MIAARSAIFQVIIDREEQEEARQGYKSRSTSLERAIFRRDEAKRRLGILLFP